jgi:cobalt-zinc-cadmium efflux system membrane fusion protein
MPRLKNLAVGLSTAAVVAAIAAVLTWPTWRQWIADDDDAGAEKARNEATAPDLVKLSPQAQKNLGLIVKPLLVEKNFWKTIELPGKIVEWQGRSDRGVTAPIAGVIKHVAAFPGDTVQPGEELFVLRLVGDSLQNSQTELYKTIQQLRIKDEEIARLEKAGDAATPEKLRDTRHQKRLLEANRHALKYDLTARGLSADLIDSIEKGKFVTQITIRVPGKKVTPPGSQNNLDPVYEVEKLDVHPGQQVHAGQMLCTLADHQALFVEGRVFKQEVPLVEHAAQAGWPVEVELPEEEQNNWSPSGRLRVLYLGNRFDAASQTVPVYVPLPNQYREYKDGDKRYRVWRYRPDHAVFLRVAVEELRNVMVLPADAVVRQGPEVYLFRQTKDGFERRPIHVLYKDRHHVVLANDGSVQPGEAVVYNKAAHLNRLLLPKIELSDEED